MEYNYFRSYSSYGEDAIFDGILKRLSWIMEEDLFQYNTYIDIGSFHPVKESNTYFLSQCNWSGTLVDPNIYFNILVHELRPNDILYNYAVDVEKGTKEFHIFDSRDSSNTLSKEFADRKTLSQHTEVSWIQKVDTVTINDIIDMHTSHFERLPFFMNIDIEGLDLAVIETYNPTEKIPFIMIEDESMDFFNKSSIRKVMEQKGYAPIAATFLTTLYLDKDSVYFLNLKKIGMFE
jgi:FkbM family methyltransferase